ncbi:hypothetical protein F2Q68_00032405 [Brassica cretica]|uniref:Uncharacterized protein n=1 Tax=Brassica cretica TaxID=69181 RepID=A0A8S9G2N1_BRACR|nr:hypothetical protein F2Q68_00032405 [Brassica cretica]
MPDWSISELDLPQVSDDSVDQVGGSSVPDDSASKRIRSGDVSEALTEVLREKTQLLRASTQKVKETYRVKSLQLMLSRVAQQVRRGVTAPPKKAKTNGSDHRLGFWVKWLLLNRFIGSFLTPRIALLRKTRIVLLTSEALQTCWDMEANNEFAATLEKHTQDIPHSDELYEIKKVVRELKLVLKMAHDRERANAAQLAAAEKLGNQAALLEARLRVVSNERKSALEQVSFLEAKVESSTNKFSDDLRRATYDAKKALADNYLDVLVSLKEKWEKKKAATDCEARLKEVMGNIDLLKEIMNNNLLASDELSRLRTKEVELGPELDVMAVSDFSVGKLDLPQISEDLPEDFFAKVPSVVDDVTKCSVGQFEDGEFDIEE